MSEYFFKMPGFVRGAGRALDLAAGLQRGTYLISDTADEADARALASDWAAVDHDFALAAARLADESKKAQPAR